MTTTILGNMVDIDTGMTDVKDGDSPLYTSDSLPPPNLGVTATNQASGSGIDSETVQGITAVTATVAGPNKLVATDKTGKLPLGIIPTISGGAPIGIVTGTYASLIASPPPGISFGIATNKGAAGMFMFYWNNATIGDNGWTVLSGS